jgi:hypothetical protein
VSPMKYELDFYIPEEDIVHSDRRELHNISIPYPRPGSSPWRQFAANISLRPVQLEARRAEGGRGHPSQHSSSRSVTQFYSSYSRTCC